MKQRAQLKTIWFSLSHPRNIRRELTQDYQLAQGGAGNPLISPPHLWVDEWCPFVLVLPEGLIPEAISRCKIPPKPTSMKPTTTRCIIVRNRRKPKPTLLSFSSSHHHHATLALITFTYVQR
jgi:hypothetical protein